MGYPVLVRMDDISPWMNIDNFTAYIDSLKRIGVKPLLGVVPDCEDADIMVSAVSDFWELMRRLKADGYLIAMHGVHHTYVSNAIGLTSTRRMSEFAGLSYEEQFKKLSHGKIIMQNKGLDTNIFFAPGHSYNKTTLKALYGLGFRYVSDGKSRKPYILEGIKCIPVNGPYRMHCNRGLLTICIHCDMETRTDLNELLLFLNEHRTDIIDFSTAKDLSCVCYCIARVQEIANIIIDKAIGAVAKIMRAIHLGDSNYESKK